MSIPRHDVSRGKLIYKGREYKVLNRPLSNELLVKCNSLDTNAIQTFTTALWMFNQCKWEIKKKKLYLTEIFQSNLLKKLTAKSELEVFWVDKLVVYVVTEVPIPSKKSLGKEILHRIDIIFRNGKYIGTEQHASTDYGIQIKRMVNYMGAQQGMFTFDKECITLGSDGIKLDCGDKFVRYLENDINSMMKKSVDGIDLSIEDFQDITTSSPKMMYVCDELCLRDDLTNDNKLELMRHFAEAIADKIQIVAGKVPTKYLIQIEIEKNFFFDAIKVLIDILDEKLTASSDNYFNFSDDDRFIVGLSSVEEYLPSDKELILIDDKLVLPSSFCAIVKIFVGL